MTTPTPATMPTPTSVTIRAATPADYPVLVALQHRALAEPDGTPILPLSVDDLEQYDREREPHIRLDRWVAEVDGSIAGWAEHDQTAYRYHPRKFWLDAYVDPAFQRRGIGAALYDTVMAALRPYKPLAVRNAVREDFTRAIAFLERRGWAVASRTWASELDVAAFDPAPYAAVAEAARVGGIEIKPLPELADDPDHERKLYELVWAIRQDLPDLDEATKEPFDVWRKQYLYHPEIPPEGYFVALHAGRYVGLLYHRDEPHEPGVLRIGQLGVAREYRGRHIATALKLRGNAYARAHGFRTLATTNDSRNAPVLAINERMGFIRKLGYVHLLKTFADGERGERSEREWV
jgi:ribosomal protein S18 acetylase RimI-like enzyme